MPIWLISLSISILFLILALIYFKLGKVLHSWFIITGREKKKQLKKLHTMSNDEVDLDVILRNASSLKEIHNGDTTRSEVSVQQAIAKANMQLAEIKRSETTVTEGYDTIQKAQEIRERKRAESIKGVVEAVREEEVTGVLNDVESEDGKTEFISLAEVKTEFLSLEDEKTEFIVVEESSKKPISEDTDEDKTTFVPNSGSIASDSSEQTHDDILASMGVDDFEDEKTSIEVTSVSQEMTPEEIEDLVNERSDDDTQAFSDNGKAEKVVIKDSLV